MNPASAVGVTHHSTGLTHTKVLLATETERKMENIDDISFRSGVYSSTDDVTIVFCRRHMSYLYSYFHR